MSFGTEPEPQMVLVSVQEHIYILFDITNLYILYIYKLIYKYKTMHRDRITMY